MNSSHCDNIMINFMQISDLHFGPFFMPAVAESVLKSAAALAPDFIIASGDFTQRATVGRGGRLTTFCAV